MRASRLLIAGIVAVAVVAVSYNEDADALRAMKKAAKAWQLTLIEDRRGRIAGQYAIGSIPHLFLIGRDGTVLATHTGYGEGSIDQLVDDLTAALAMPDSTDSTVKN